jgi:hypothetical protein
MAEFSLPKSDEPLAGITPSGDFLITGQSAAGGSLPVGINLRSLPEDLITVDLAYDVVMGWVDPSESVSVTVAGTDGYGMAVADEVGFFWTTIWTNTGGYHVGLNCGMTLVIQVGSADPLETTPPCMDAGLDIVNDLVTASIEDDTGETTITATLGVFEIWSGGQPPAPGAPSAVGVTASNGSFSQAISGVDLGAESLVALDRVVDGVNIRSYAYPEPSVFMVNQYNSIAGYAGNANEVTATVFIEDTEDERWSNTLNVGGPHRYYLFDSIEMYDGDRIEVSLDGGTPLSTVLFGFGNFDFTTTEGTLAGTAPNGATVRASFWQWTGEERLYTQEQVTAANGDVFSMDLSSTGLQPRDDVLVAVADDAGNQVQLLSGPPFVNAWLDLQSDLDCVVGRLDGPGLPVHTRLEKSGEDPYTRDTGWFSDAGNSIVACFTMRDASDNFVNFSPGDTMTLHSNGESAWEGAVTIVPMAWSGDSAGNSISGDLPAGDLEVTVAQWNAWGYPLHGTATRQISHDGLADFTADFTDFDVRDGNMVYLSHYDPNTGFGNYTHNWVEAEYLAFFEIYPAYNTIGGRVDKPGAGVTARLYNERDTLIAETSEDRDEHAYWFWLDDFQGESLQPGYRVEIFTTNGWFADMIIPEMTLDADRITIPSQPADQKVYCSWRFTMGITG